MYDNGNPDPRKNPPDHEVDVSGTRARQGRRGTPVLMVLVGGLILVAIVWALVELYGEGIQDESRELNPSGQQSEQTTPQDPNQLPPAGQN
ncbi:hypothetical protein GCM10011385_14600 [Nitratireductor aestuarii]|jgi:hypothetical protein|uniref:Uncharacterized protein n=1 Tax=Nitratireductor aestuarii TaxID=1735103 RepID=A0A916RLM4_9HYPH|nr:hypothetical protein [Nitratireductor aestuarii]GGA61924.1 hypothetical protein GCM10011385_14600 [Nitratireductor aestuarii]